MREDKLSQTESRRLTAYLREQYQLSIGDALLFWRMTPSAIEARLYNKFALTISAAEIVTAIGR